jgi:hypothetical protein
MWTSLATDSEGVDEKRIIINMFSCRNKILTGIDGINEYWFGAKLRRLVLSGNPGMLKLPDCAATLVG